MKAKQSAETSDFPDRHFETWKIKGSEVGRSKSLCQSFLDGTRRAGY